MLNNSFNNINFMEKALDGYWKRNETINNNISNVNTPGYKKTKVEFEENLKNELNIQRGLKVKTTDPKHMKFIGQRNTESIKVTKDETYSTRKDGNNVNIDVEMANLAKNTMMYNALIKQVSSETKKLRSIINEGR
ncbi:flagellar basal body rod protein FlgB [Clostridium sp. D2Q-11]|uniref:Flagellar basal body rod protein FlgB n=1 Tax=Anaeromonas frigoriresistens TaxID=2683708 RepID=A0A942UVI6_9FIRM|nr:flagellar basal body rod protein FlgB [Anaeromonas frigoriresistens]MBS4539838.1 flagellar basal body rod protein FlgB [Anaeromonas frigoriresistens]